MRREAKDFTGDDPFAGFSTIDIFDLHKRDITKVPLLDRGQEVLLAKQIETGRLAWKELQTLGFENGSGIKIEELKDQIGTGLLAREHFILANTGLVISIAKRYIGLGVDFLDLIQNGYPGLIRAVDKFDGTLGNKFSGWATPIISREIRTAIYEKNRSIKQNTERRMRPALILRGKLRDERGHEPTLEELAELTHLKKSAILRYFQISAETISLDSDQENNYLSETLSDPRSSWEIEALFQAPDIDVQGLLSQLSAKNRKVIEMRNGLGEYKKSYTLEEIGNEMGVTREAIRQREEKAYSILRVLIGPRNQIGNS